MTTIVPDIVSFKQKFQEVAKELNINKIPNNKNIVLVFDVETSGLIPRRPMNSTQTLPISNYPYIIQFSFILYDIKNDNIMDCYDSFIKIPDDIQISDEITNLTGINNYICQNIGKSIIEAIRSFYNAYKQCNTLIAHNMDFDKDMIMIEIERNREIFMSYAPECFCLFQPMYERVNNIDKYCTMRNGTNICNIIVESKIEGKPPRKKWPKLIELYEKLFEEKNVEGLHNSLVDIFVCLKCYLKMRYKVDFNYSLENLLIFC
jgi:DNA polymerase III epsilon subunit-like protein